MSISLPAMRIKLGTATVALLALSGCSQASPTASSTISRVPILGNYPLGGASGYGQVRPATIYGGDPSGRVTSIRWNSWEGLRQLAVALATTSRQLRPLR